MLAAYDKGDTVLRNVTIDVREDLSAVVMSVYVFVIQL